MSIFLCYSLRIYYILITILYKLHLYQIYLNIYYYLEWISTTAFWSIHLPEEFFPIQVFTESSVIFSDFLFMLKCFYSVKVNEPIKRKFSVDKYGQRMNLIIKLVKS